MRPSLEDLAADLAADAAREGYAAVLGRLPDAVREVGYHKGDDLSFVRHHFAGLCRVRGIEGAPREGWKPETSKRSGAGKRATGDDPSAWGFVELDGVRAEPVAWLWPGWIPAGMLTVVDGRPDAGKTTVLCDLAARVTRARAMPSETAPPPERVPGAVIFVTSENAFAQVLRPRLEAAGADLSRCIGWAVTPEKDGTPDCPRLPRDAERLEAAARHYGAALVVVDPLFSHMDGELNPNRETDVRRALVPLSRIAEATGAAVVAVRHFNKGANGDAINAGGGSIGIVGTARVQIVVGRAPDVPETDPARVVAVGKMNIAQKPPARAFCVVGVDVDGVPTSRAEWGGIVSTTAGDLTRAMSPAGPTGTARDEVADWLRAVLEAGPRLAREVWAEAEEMGFAEATVKRTKRAMKVHTYQEGFGASGGWWWELPTAPGASQAQGISASHTDPMIPCGEGDPLWANSPENAVSQSPCGPQNARGSSDPLSPARMRETASS